MVAFGNIGVGFALGMSVSCYLVPCWFACKGVYPQSDGSLAIVDINASKGFVDLWEHLALAIFANFDVKKTTEMAFDQDLTCLIFPFRWAGFLFKLVKMPSGNTYFLWISMIFPPFTLFFYSNKNISI